MFSGYWYVVFTLKKYRDFMKLEVLLSCMHQEDMDIARRTGIQSDLLIINQCGKNEAVETVSEGHRHRMLSTTERGLSRSRNMALENACGDICLICDDDERLEEGYSGIISDAFAAHPDADIIAFNFKNPYRTFPLKQRKIGYIGALRLASWQIAFRRKAVADRGIRFDETMGAGVTMGGGEENKFLQDCLRAGLSIIYLPVCIGSVSQEQSTWDLTKDNAPAYFHDRGEAYGKIMGKWLGAAYIIYSSVRKYGYYTRYAGFFDAVVLQFKGLYK